MNDQGDRLIPGILDAGINWPAPEGRTGAHAQKKDPYKAFGGTWILNDHVPDYLLLSDEERHRKLTRAGIAIHSSAENPGRLFRVPVFHLEALAVERIRRRVGLEGRQMVAGAPGGSPGTGGKGSVPESWTEADPLYRRITRTAVRALYTLGLDIGEVEVCVDDAGRTAVRRVELPPPPDLAGGGVWSAALQRFAADYDAARGAARAAEPGPLRIGADPEFVLLREDGRVASAARYLDPRGEAGCDAVPVGRRLLYPVAELRPAPADGPAALAAALQQLLRRAAGRIGEPGLRWLAGGMPVPGLALGGHIHLSGVWLSSRLLRTLDSCVAFPLALVEDPAGLARRPRYGWLGDFRRKPHGGFEYRTPPSWLVSPAAARAAFALAMLAAHETWTLGARYGDLPSEQEELVQAYYAGDKAALYRGMEPFMNRLAATPSYRTLAQWIEPLFDAIGHGRTWDEQLDIRHKWRIPVT
ncbi:hypothetical protein ACFOHW_21005 [Paenibacillus abyssi]